MTGRVDSSPYVFLQEGNIYSTDEPERLLAAECSFVFCFAHLACRDWINRHLGSDDSVGCSHTLSVLSSA